MEMRRERGLIGRSSRVKGAKPRRQEGVWRILPSTGTEHPTPSLTDDHPHPDISRTQRLSLYGTAALWSFETTSFRISLDVELEGWSGGIKGVVWR
eukprot:323272-Hanusia_phi.AAC.1